MIRLHRASLAYRADEPVLHSVTLYCPSGSMTALVGPSGAGKSSVLRLIAGLIEPTAGEVEVDTHRWQRLKPGQAAQLRRRLGLVTQTDTLLPDRTVFDNVALPLIIGGFNRHTIGPRVVAALRHVRLDSCHKALPDELSAGHRQRVALARAVVAQPQVLLIDEPAALLDERQGAQIMALLTHFRRAGVTVLLTTQDSSLPTRFPMTCCYLTAGRINEGANERSTESVAPGRDTAEATDSPAGRRPPAALPGA